MTNFQKLIAIFRQNQKYQIAVFIALLFLGWFYWFQLRPIQVRSECTDVAKEMANKKTYSSVTLMYPIVKQVQELVKQGKGNEAKKLVEDLTSTEYNAYKAAKELEEVNGVLFMKDDFDFSYNLCLHERGLK